MIRYIAVLMLSFLSQQLFAQIMISGTVTSDGEPIAGANILLYTADGNELLGFSSTDGEGHYHIDYTSSVGCDTIMVTVTGFNVKKTSKCVTYRTQIVNFDVLFEELSIKEVIVQATPIERRSDTLNYYVNSYIDSLDHSIGDVLRKMPGIDVQKSGQILYYNKPITRFYIEGLDMLGGRYGLATNNVMAKDIATVQILENHQPIKALKNIIFSDAAALNLKLKNRAKGALAATILLGAGYKPWIWNAELTAMQFSPNIQFLGTYKTNNSGEDITAELKSFHGGIEEGQQLTDVHTPSLPNIDKERYMDNITHASSVNALLKLKEDHTLTFNAKYLHDLQKYRSESLTTYYLPEGQSLEIAEGTYASKLSDAMETELKYEVNTTQLYLKESLVFAADWNKNDGEVQIGTNNIDQYFRMEPRLRLRNILNVTKVVNAVRFNINSRINLSHLPTTLSVTPVLYPHIFGGDSTSFQGAIQDLSSKKLYTDNSVYAGYTLGRFYLSGGVGVSALIENLRTSLFANDLSGQKTLYPDSLANDNIWRQYDLKAIIYASYQYRSLSISFSSDIDWMNLYFIDKIRNSPLGMNRLFVNPSLSFSARLTSDLKINADAYLSNKIGSGATGIYYGYIMNDYRVVGNNSGQIAESALQNYRLNLDYGNALISLFASLQGGYWRSQSNVMYGTDYYGSLSRMKTYAIDNLSQGLSISGRVEKRFDDIATTLSIPIRYSRTYTNILRQNKIMKIIYWSLPMGIEVSSSFLARKLRADYNIAVGRTKSIIRDNIINMTPIDILTQKMTISALPTNNITLKLTGEHYYNSTISDGSRSIFFLDLSFILKINRFEYIIEGRNLTNPAHYCQRLYSDITAYAYSYSLRPMSFLFKVKFGI